MDARKGGNHGEIEKRVAMRRGILHARMGLDKDVFGIAHTQAHGADGGGRGRTGYNRVRHSGRGAGGDCNSSDYDLPSSLAGAMERNRRRHKRIVRIAYPSTNVDAARSGHGYRSGLALTGSAGQATVEFAVVTFGFLAATAALALLWHALSGEMVAQHAAAVASHHIQAIALATLPDIFLY